MLSISLTCLSAFCAILLLAFVQFLLLGTDFLGLPTWQK
jgi:hypothetical protein